MTFEGSGDTHSHRGRQGCWGGIQTRGRGDASSMMIMVMVMVAVTVMVIMVMILTFWMIKIKVHGAGCQIKADKRPITERCVCIFALCSQISWTLICFVSIHDQIHRIIFWGVQGSTVNTM